jgi:hypothetical protein
MNSHIEEHAVGRPVLPLEHHTQHRVEFVEGDLGEETEATEIHAKNGDRARPYQSRHREQGSISPDHHDQVGGVEDLCLLDS